MANYVKVNIVSPCGNLLGTKTNNSESGSVTSGVKTCSSCKKKFSYQIRGENAYTSYK